ncbi:20953_t:CDS:2, partial [Cetraspora pellucida]
ISDVSLKQNLVNKLISECKRKDKVSGELLKKGKLMSLDNDDYMHSVGGLNINKQEEEYLETKATDKALNIENVDYLLLAKQVALEKAYVVRIANQDG